MDAGSHRGSGAWPLSELLICLWSVGLAGTNVSKAGMMLMGPQLCLVITAQPKRGLEPPWEVPVGEGRSKSIFICSGVCLLALDPLTEDSKCFPLSSVIPDAAVSSPSSGLVCSRKAELSMGCKCTVKQLRLALSFLSTCKPREPASQRWIFQTEITLGTCNKMAVRSALQRHLKAALH